MEKSSELKRYSVKYIRDAAKSAYVKDDHCCICDATEELQLHHYASLADLWTNWCRRNKIRIECVEDVLAIRDQFIAQHHDELYNDVVTLCKGHHQELHQNFGKAPAPGLAKAQDKWVALKRRKWLEKLSIKT